MNLLFIVDNRSFGGGHYGAFMLAIELSKLGHDVRFVTSRIPILTGSSPSPDLPSFMSSIIRPVVPRLARGFGLLDRWWLKIYDRVMLPLQIRKFDPDVVIGLQGPEATRAVSLGRRFGAKTANLVFETPEHLYANREPGTRLQPHEAAMWKRFEAALNQTHKNWMGKSNSTVIYAGVDVERADAVPASVEKTPDSVRRKTGFVQKR